jgi:lipopolysaccharide/colanic/teichoic acid biosynthesis glycosyltransferase
MNPRAIRHTIFAGDLASLTLSAVAACMLRSGGPWNAGHLRIAFHESTFLMATAGVVWLLVFHRLKLDGFYGGYEVAATLSQLFTGTVALVLLVASASFLLHQDGSRLLLASFAVLFFLAAFAGRLAARALARRFADKGSRRRVLILGKGRLAHELADRIEKHPEMRWELVGFLFPSADDFVDPVLLAAGSAQLNSLKIDSLLKQQAVDDVVLAGPVPNPGEMLNLVANCRQRGIRVSVVPDLYELYVNRPALLDLDGLPLLHFADRRRTLIQSAVKRGFDLTVSLTLLLAVSPLLVLSGLLLCVQKGKAVVAEKRCGRNGRPFLMYRFNIPRGMNSVSTVERVLQMLSVTELPQLLNVLKGDMSLVGPRPETEERVKRYSDWQRQRLIRKPGMTGLAQVHGLREESASEHKAYYDLRYIQDPSLLTDLALILQTMWIIPRRFFAARASETVPLEAHSAQNRGEFAELAHADRP